MAQNLSRRDVIAVADVFVMFITLKHDLQPRPISSIRLKTVTNVLSLFKILRDSSVSTEIILFLIYKQ